MSVHDILAAINLSQVYQHFVLDIGSDNGVENEIKSEDVEYVELNHTIKNFQFQNDIP